MKPHSGLVKIVTVLSLNAIFSGCIKDTNNGVMNNHVKELDTAEQMYGSLGFNRNQAWPLFTAERDSTGKPIPVDIKFVAQCLELYKKHQITPGINNIVLFQQEEWDWQRIEEFIKEEAKYLPRVQY